MTIFEFKKSITTVIGGVSFAIAIFIGSSSVNAVSLAINNAGFEEPNLTNEPPVDPTGEVFTFETPPGWDLYDPDNLIPDDLNDRNLGTGYPGVWSPSNIFYSNGIPEGNNIAAIFLPQAPNSGSVALTQTLSTTLKANTQYTLQVDVGNPGSDFFAGFPGYRIELWVGNNLVAQDNNSLDIAEGAFVTSVISYTALDNDSNLEQPLEIKLFHLLAGTGGEVNFDNVRLNTTLVPENSSNLSIIALGALGATSTLKRKKN
jgi:hypothetical protein